MTCQHCGAKVVNGLALCDLCMKKAATILEYLPIYFRNLARWRPGRTGARQVPGSRVLYDGSQTGRGDRISDTLDEAYIALNTYATKLTVARPYLTRLYDRLLTARREERIDEAQAVAWLATGFTRHLTAIATLDWAGGFIRDLDHHEHRLRALTETSIPGWYAGACRHCQADTHVVPGLTWLTCRHCGTVTAARDHVELVLDEARDWVDRPKHIAEAIVALIDTEQSVPRLYERIKKWEQRGRIPAVRRLDADGDEVGPKLYRLGDVLDILTAEGATRLDQVAVPAS